MTTTKGRGCSRPTSAMTPAKFDKRRKALFPSKAAAARYLGVTWQTVHYWTTGFHPVPTMVRLIFEFLEERNRQNAALPSRQDAPTDAPGPAQATTGG